MMLSLQLAYAAADILAAAVDIAGLVWHIPAPAQAMQ
jgi:hypothetical protein